MSNSRIFRKLVALISLWPALGLGCTTLTIPQSPQKLVGKSYDWHQNHGFALVNARNLEKTALLLSHDRPAQWTSRYGSLTFNQHGRELPLGGINEVGLSVEIMWLDSSEYPVSGLAPVINELQWIQYQLDNAATVGEAARLAQSIRVVPVVAKVHYLVCDISGACATFEYLGQKLVIHSEKSAPVVALTNHPYEDSLKFLAQHMGFGGAKPLPPDDGSLARFARAAAYVKSYDATKVADPVASVFNALASVAQPNHTTWNLVYERTGNRVHFRTKGLPGIKTIDTSHLDYSCDHPAQFLDMKTASEGNITGAFAAFGPQHNLALVKTGLSPFMNQIPAGTVDLVAQYPASLKCKN